MSAADTGFEGTGFENTGFTDRDQLWQQLRGDAASAENPGASHGDWDMIIVGGGITGAGILREAVRRRLKVLLVEQRDFAWGTSSRSSKMVHGGLRYIAQGDIKLTRHALRERERLLREAPGLVERMGYHFALRKGQFPGRLAMTAVLALYDALAGIRDHRYIRRDQLQSQFQGIRSDTLKGACYYTDSTTDDARLVLRVLQEAVQAGGQVLNYTRAAQLLKHGPQVCGLQLENAETGERVEVKARVVVNATGAWADRLRSEVKPEQRVRPLRGSHLILEQQRLPVDQCLTLMHPADQRPVFIFPWEGRTVVGTTDLDHRDCLDTEASISAEEVDYLLRAVASEFPEHGIGRDDIISTFAGVRPVIASDNAKDPSKERRDHAVWQDHGLVTVSGGKLTTFRLIALDVLKAAAPYLKLPATQGGDERVFAPVSQPLEGVAPERAERLQGRYGALARALLASTPAAEQQPLGDTQFCLAECRWAARHEAVQHLDDLLLRRTRLGSLLKNGAEELFADIERICAEELGWDEQRWQAELDRYREIWRRHYYLPETAAEAEAQTANGEALPA